MKKEKIVEGYAVFSVEAKRGKTLLHTYGNEDKVEVDELVFNDTYSPNTKYECEIVTFEPHESDSGKKHRVAYCKIVDR